MRATIAILGLLVCTPIFADQVNALRFKPALSTDSYYVESGADTFQGIGKEYRGLVSLNFESVDNAISVVDRGGQEKVTELVRSLQRVRATAAYQVTRRLILGLTVPVDNVDALQPFDTTGGNALTALDYEGSGWILGDVHLTSKLRLFSEDHSWNWTLIGSVVAPTGDEEFFNTDDSLGFGLGVGFTRHLNPKWKVYGNLGYFFAQNSKLIVNRSFKTFDASQRFTAAAGMNYRFIPNFSAYIESATQIGFPFNDFQNPLAVNLGVNAYWKDFIFTAGYGLEEYFDEDHSKNRFYAGVKFQFSKNKSWDKEAAIEKVTQRSVNYINAELRQKTVAAPPMPGMWGTVGPMQGDHNVYFATSRSTIIPIFHRSLDQMAGYIKSLPDQSSAVGIVGHTDSSGSKSINESLSRSRATAVRNYFVNKHGIDSSRFDMSYKGMSQPITPETDTYTRTLNRRVEIKLPEMTP